jgi:probable F420-dependent oxidoreductase
MGIGFGLLSAQLRPGETDWSRAYQETVELTVHAERLGFSSIWTTEHHFVDDGYMPSLLVMSAAFAAATSRIEIGTGVVLAPLHHPLRLAEDAATVQLLSQGRLVLGLGLGWVPIEFDGLGVDIGRRGRSMEEILEILPQAWSGEPFHHQGTVYELPRLAVRPAPSQQIPIVIGGGAEPAIRRAARLADGLFSNVPPARFVEQVTWVRDELEKAGRDEGSFRFIHYSVMIPADNVEEAWAEMENHLWHMAWKYSDMEVSATRPGPPPEAPAEGRERRRLERSTLIGPSDQIVERLLEIRQQAGVPVDFVARSYLSTLEQSRQLELMQRLSEEVGPYL